MNKIKRLATPLTIGAFFIMTVTGILMFYHLDTGMNKFLHEWFSWAFLAAALLHAILVHKKTFIAYFEKKPARIVFAASLLVLGLSFMQIGDEKRNPFAQTTDSVLKADLGDVGSIMGLTVADLQAGLKGRGLDVQFDHTTLKKISHDSGISERELLGYVLALRKE